MYKTNLFIVFLITTIFLGISQESQGILLKPPLKEKDLVTEKKKKFIHFYFAAEKYKLLEEYNEALIQYEKCTFLIPEEPAPYYQIGKLYLYIYHDLDNAEYYMKEAIKLNHQNKWYYYELLSIYAVQNNIEKQLETYYGLIDFDPKNEFYNFEVIRLLVELKEYKKAIRLVKKVEKKLGTSNELLLAEKDIYLAQNNFEAAEKVGQKLIQKSPQFYNTLAEIYMHFNDYENAITTYNKVLQHTPNDPIAIIALYTIFSNKEEVEKQELLLFQIARNNEINIETKKEIFYNLLLNNKFQQYKSFKKIIKEAVSLHQKEPLFNLILGDIYSKEKNYNKAIEHYELSLNSGIIKDEYIYTKLIEIYWEKEQLNDLLNITKTALERFPLVPMFYYYQGIALSSQDKHELSIKTLLKGKDLIFENNLLLSDFYSLLGNSYHSLKDNSSSDDAYENALKYNPENTYVLNNYSYYLSNRGENLTLAKKMIIKCLELTSEEPNPSFIDTYAWVLYQLGEYESAKIEIEKALQLQKSSSVLFDHHGDILYKLGFKNQALVEWKKAYELNLENQEIKQKITNYMLNE